MGLSSNILWHQTTLDGLKGILNEQGFFYSYSLESILSRESKNNLNVAFPMVSLCDLPFSELNDYIKKYGGYLIGMKRTWGKSNGLAPVWYCDSESTILNAIIDRYNQIEVNIKNGKNFTISREIFLYTLSHIKNYEGQLIAHDFNKYRFYDEREFRSVPRYKELKKLHPTIQPYLSEKDYQDYKRKHKNTLIKTLKLSFEWEDIRYIVVKRKQDIKTISELLQNLAPDIHPQIFTTQQILEDVIGCNHNRQLSISDAKWPQHFTLIVKNFFFRQIQKQHNTLKRREQGAGENFPAPFSQQIRGQTLQFCKVCPFSFSNRCRGLRTSKNHHK